MFYYLYEIKNLINNKIYVGVHKTNDLNDGYMGSGKVIRRAIKKSEEHKANMRKPKEKILCLICNKMIGGHSNYKQWHGDNCKPRLRSTL